MRRTLQIVSHINLTRHENYGRIMDVRTLARRWASHNLSVYLQIKEWTQLSAAGLCFIAILMIRLEGRHI